MITFNPSRPVILSYPPKFLSSLLKNYPFLFVLRKYPWRCVMALIGGWSTNHGLQTYWKRMHPLPVAISSSLWEVVWVPQLKEALKVFAFRTPFQSPIKDATDTKRGVRNLRVKIWGVKNLLTTVIVHLHFFILLPSILFQFYQFSLAFPCSFFHIILQLPSFYQLKCSQSYILLKLAIPQP